MKLKRLLITTLLIAIGQQGFGHVAAIPMEFTGKHIFIRVRAGNNDTLRFVFDTGATGASIDSLTAERAGISRDYRRKVLVAVSGGEQAYLMATGERLGIGKAQLENVNLVLINFASLSERIDVKINYANQKIYLRPNHLYGDLFEIGQIN